MNHESVMSSYENMSEIQQFACRVIADHARATAFSIADGILPGNEGRNYVLRKIMRRAIYHGREHLGFKEPFFYKVCDFVVDQMHEAFPELAIQRDFISKMVRLEEERFGNTLSEGLSRVTQNLSKPTVAEFLEQLKVLSLSFNRVAIEIANKVNQMNETVNIWAKQESVQKILSFLAKLGEEQRRLEEFKTKQANHNDELANEAEVKTALQLSTEDANQIENKVKTLFLDLAKLYDTYGTPKDLIRVELEEKGLPVDEETFDANFESAVQELQKQSGIGRTERKSEINPMYAEIANTIELSKFRGYETTQLENVQVTALIKGDERIDVLNEGEEGLIVLNETPFYAESGGQVGDTGIFVGESGVRVKVLDTFAPVGGLILHKSRVESGSVRIGDRVTAVVDEFKRDATRRNHTATHLVHAALKEVLGTHVKQAGSVVAPGYLRFDFTHYQPMTDSEIQEVEDLVNRYILQNEPVNTNMMALEEAMRSGAVAMFGEKYGSEVRVLSVGDGKFSMELCGGTHVRATGDIGTFKITSDEAIASGVRRIRAITGFDALKRFREDEVLIDRSLDVLKTQRDNLPDAIRKLQEELKRTRREMEDLKLKIATGGVSAMGNGDETRDVKGVKVLGKIVDGLDANGQRQLSDTLLARLKSGVVVLGRADNGKASIIVRVSDDLKDKIKAGNVIKEIVQIVGGRGGGRPDMAEGGGPETEKLQEAIEESYNTIANMLE